MFAVNFHLPAEQALRTPSAKDGVPITIERNNLCYAVDAMRHCARLMELEATVFTRAAILFHRFYCKRSVQNHDVRNMVAPALVLACKLEDARPAAVGRDIRILMRMAVTVAHHVFQLMDGNPEPALLEYTPGDGEYARALELLMERERELLATLGFIFHVEHPQRFLLFFAKALELDEAVAQSAWGFLLDSLRLSLHCYHPGNVVTSACIYLAFRTLQRPMPRSVPPWWELFDTSTDELFTVVRALMALRAGEVRSEYTALVPKPRVVEDKKKPQSKEVTPTESDKGTAPAADDPAAEQPVGKEPDRPKSRDDRDAERLKARDDRDAKRAKGEPNGAAPRPPHPQDPQDGRRGGASGRDRPTGREPTEGSVRSNGKEERRSSRGEPLSSGPAVPRQRGLWDADPEAEAPPKRTRRRSESPSRARVEKFKPEDPRRSEKSNKDRDDGRDTDTRSQERARENERSRDRPPRAPGLRPPSPDSRGVRDTGNPRERDRPAAALRAPVDSYDMFRTSPNTSPPSNGHSARPPRRDLSPSSPSSGKARSPHTAKPPAIAPQTTARSRSSSPARGDAPSSDDTSSSSSSPPSPERTPIGSPWLRGGQSGTAYAPLSPPRPDRRSRTPDAASLRRRDAGSSTLSARRSPARDRGRPMDSTQDEAPRARHIVTRPSEKRRPADERDDSRKRVRGDR